ncbi:MAG: hypothetical protein HYV15_01555, partial [Elusimicrobia bacterium]|nr:hypothetical protein [Elusimicrobiota bacterium]
MRRAFAAFLLLAIPSAGGAMPALTDADAKFDKGLYQEALPLYEAVLAGGAEADRPKALWRACESEALLFRYGSAFERLRAAKLPGDALWKDRFMLLRAELGREYLKQYSGGQPQDEEEGAEDAFKLTEEQLRAGVEDAFFALWERREALARVPVADEPLVIEADKSDSDRYPTLLDFIVLRWGEYNLQERPQPDGARKPAAASFLKDGYDGRVAKDAPPAALAGAVYEAAARLGGPGRETAAEVWRLRRAEVPFAAGGKAAPFEDDAKGREAAAALFRRWWESFKTAEGRGEAGFKAADLLNGLGRPDEAVALCDEAARAVPGTWGASRCERLAAQIRMPELSLSARVVPPPGTDALTISGRNLGRVHLRFYATT